jgi:hypothetical protein
VARLVAHGQWVAAAGSQLVPEHRSRRRKNGTERRKCCHHEKREHEDKIEGGRGKTVAPAQAIGSEIYKVAKKIRNQLPVKVKAKFKVTSKGMFG